MFKVETREVMDRWCSNGHSPLPDPWPSSDHAPKFCHLCGAPVRQQATTCDAALCANCNNPVDPTWNYCPYCGQDREEGSKHAD